jgi:hypothetical protein
MGMCHDTSRRTGWQPAAVVTYAAPMARLRIAWTLLTVAVAAAFVTPAGAQRFGGGYYLITDMPLGYEIPLRRAIKDGYSFAAVARPEGRLLPATVAVLVSRPEGASGGAPELEVVVARPGPIDDFQDAVNTVAARGFRMVGLTYTAPVWGSANTYTPIAIMQRVPAGDAPPEYRVIRTRYDRDQRAALNAAGAGGFVVTHLFSYPLDATTTDSVPVYVAEKTTVTPAVRYHLTFAETATALEASLDRYAGEGYRLQGLWTANTRVIALLTKPLEGAWPDPREYAVDDPATLFFSRVYGALTGVVRHRDRFLGVYDLKAPRTEYTVTTGQIADEPLRPFPVTERRKALFLEKLDSDAGRGYAPVEFTLRSGTGRNLEATVLLGRTRP